MLHLIEKRVEAPVLQDQEIRHGGAGMKVCCKCNWSVRVVRSDLHVVDLCHCRNTQEFSNPAAVRDNHLKNIDGPLFKPFTHSPARDLAFTRGDPHTRPGAAQFDEAARSI